MQGSWRTSARDDHINQLVTSISSRLKRLSPESNDCCIFVVPDKQRGNRSADSHVSVTIESLNIENPSHNKFNSRKENLAFSIRKKLKSLPPQPSECCIFRVPEKLQRGYEEAYRPRVIAIGPYHHCNESLMLMEDHKLRYLQSFLRHNQKCRLEDCIEKIRSWEDRARRCYDEPIDLDSDE